MSSLDDLLQFFQDRNEKLENLVGLNSLQRLSQITSGQSEIQNSLNRVNGLIGLTNIAKEMSQKVKFSDNISKITGGSLSARMELMQEAYKSPFSGLTSTLSSLAATNPLLSEKLSEFAASQIILSSSLSAIASLSSHKHQTKFNSLDIAVRSLSRSFLRDIAADHSWYDITVVEEANETISKVSDEFISESKPITKEDLDNLRTSIIKSLSDLHTKTNTEKGKTFIFNLITVIGFLLTLYSIHKQELDISNQDLMKQFKSDFEACNIGLSMKIDSELEKLNQTRIARTNVNLRHAAKKKSQIIGLVKKGQIVRVIETHHKFILIYYIDIETREHMSGFACKKYFDKE